MIYVCKKELYNSIAGEVTTRDLRDSKLTLNGFMCRYFESWLSMPKGTITKIQFS